MPANESETAHQRLVVALDAHLRAVQQRRSEHDPQVQAAYLELRAAAADYDDALYAEHDEVTPFALPPLYQTDEDTEAEPPDPNAPRLSVLARWEYGVVDRERLLDSARAALGEAVDSNALAVAALAHVRGHSGLAEPAGAETAGLSFHGATTWVVTSDAEPGKDEPTWLAEPFEVADPASVLCRFDLPPGRGPGPPSSVEP